MMNKDLNLLIDKYMNIKDWANTINSAKKVDGSESFSFYEIPEEIKELNLELPQINRIQTPEPHSLISDYFLFNYDWLGLKELIKPLLEEAFLAFNLGMYNSSISCGINCYEYILKYEYLRKIAKENEIKSNNKFKEKLTLGSFLQNNDENNFIKSININNLSESLQNLNDIRNGYFHHNVKKLIKVSKLFSDRLKRTNLLSQTHEQIEIAYYVFITLSELVKYFYNEKTNIDFHQECVNDYKKRKQEILNWMKENNQIGGFNMGDYFDKKSEHIQNEINKLKNK